MAQVKEKEMYNKFPVENFPLLIFVFEWQSFEVFQNFLGHYEA